MTRKPHFFKLGLFVILAFGLTAGLLIAFGAGQFLKKEFLAETCFDESVQGLDIGSEVKYKGVKIGTVKTITTPSRMYDIPSSYVLVTFSLSENCYVGQTGENAEERLKKAIEEGLTVSLAFKGLTGAAYLETDYRSRREVPLSIDWAPQNTYLPSRRSTIKRAGDAISQAFEAVSNLDVQGIAGNLASLVEMLNEKAEQLDMAQISHEAENLLKELRQTNDQLGKILKSPKLHQAVADAGDTFADLKNMIHEAQAPVDTTLKNIETASANVKGFSMRIEQDYAQKLNALLTHLEKTSRMLENTVWVNSDNISRSIESFENAAENLNQLTLELKQYPGRLLLERPPQMNTPESLKEKVNE